MARRTLVWTSTLFLFAAALSGCFGDGDGGEQETTPTDTTGTDGGNQTRAVMVEITDIPTSVAVTESVNVTWTVETEDNVTLEITSTRIVYGSESVDNPESPEDYGNVSGESVGTTPAEFSTTFTADMPGSLYVRAHAIVDGVDYWSPESTVEVTGGGPGGEPAKVEIASAATGYLSSFDPDELTITVGTMVVWENMDDQTHTATAEDESWGTGDVAGQASSEGILFTEPGTFEYRCNYHPQTMTGTIVVEEA